MVMLKILYKTKKQALKAYFKCGAAGYMSTVDSRTDLEFDDSLGANFDSWAGETQCIRTDNSDIFAWWE